jgi:small conductance mechanosensitive channel
MDIRQISDTATAALTTFGLKVLGALLAWIVGRYLIGLAVRMVSAGLMRQQVDPTLLRYLGTIISVALNVVLVVAILGYFGVETTSFAALVAAMGVAIGAAGYPVPEERLRMRQAG